MNTVMKILSNKTTRNAILLTIGIIFVYRMGSLIITPGINSDALLEWQANSSENFTQLFDFFGGGSLSTMALFALGVSPYITASIVIQLLESELVPSMKEWKHQGVDGQNKRARYTRNTALVFAFFQ